MDNVDAVPTPRAAVATDRPVGAAGPAERMASAAGDVARPVALDLGADQEERVRRWIEGFLGWQVVDDQLGGLVPPTVHLLGPTAAVPRDPIPRVLLVDAGAAPQEVLVACHRLRPDASLVWPAQRDELAATVARCTQRLVDDGAGHRVLRIGGLAGGVGTTTVALAVAGLAAWRGATALAAVRGDVPAEPALVLTAEALAAPDLWSRLEDLPGVAGCRVARIGDPAPAVDPSDRNIDLAVLDHGADPDCDLAVCRPDAAALEQLAATTASIVAVVGTGPVRPAQLREAAGGRTLLGLPWSARVARAGLRRRIPASLPGAWLRRLLPVVPSPSGANGRERSSDTLLATPG